MKTIYRLFSILLLAGVGLSASAERVERLPFGKMDTWTVRYIKESRIIGGNTIPLYMIAPTDTIEGNAPFKYGKKGNIWSTSNAYAKVSGVEKASVTVIPEKRGSGYCARLEVKDDAIKAMGIININVLAAGSIFTGETIEPVDDPSDAMTNISFGVPFTKMPTALQFDYKTKISSENTVSVIKAGKSKKTLNQHDRAQVFILLQKRWETPDGKIKALRVATGQEYFGSTVSGWQNGHRVPIVYGESTLRPLMKDFCAKNSKGKCVPIEETGFAPEGTAPTHMLIYISASSAGTFIGHVGNMLWVDNIALVYAE